MTLVLSVMAMGSAMANDNSAAKRPKKGDVVFVVTPHHSVPCNCYHDCHKFDPHHKACNHNHNHKKGCEWGKNHKSVNHPVGRPNFNNNNRPPMRGDGPNNGPKPTPGYGKR